MRIVIVATILLLLTACGAQGAPTARPAATLPGSEPPAATAAPLAPTATSAATASSAPASAATTGAGGAPTAAGQLATSAPATAAAPTSSAAPPPSEYTAANGDRVRGLPSAPITMLDYSDFQ